MNIEHGTNITVYTHLVDSPQLYLCNVDSGWCHNSFHIMNIEHGTNTTVYSHLVDSPHPSIFVTLTTTGTQ